LDCGLECGRNDFVPTVKPISATHVPFNLDSLI